MSDFLVESVIEELSKRDNKIIELNTTLKLIKDKQISMPLFLDSIDVNFYNDKVDRKRKLTKEEYNKLKELFLSL